jgi:hypothetical protein
MDRVADGGVGWRNEMTSLLQPMGIIVLNPCDKPIGLGCEDIESREYRQQLKVDGQYEKLAKEVRELRVVDLRMVDLADFLIVYINTDVHMTGTYEELFLGNRMKMPILCMIEGGKEKVPDWLLGVLPHEHMFGNWSDLLDYLMDVDCGKDTRHFKRWMFFDYEKMLPKVPKVESEIFDVVY